MVEKKQWAADKKAGLVDGKFPMPEPKLGKLPGQKPKPGVAVDDAGSSSAQQRVERMRGRVTTAQMIIFRQFLAIFGQFV